jgi:hypothetical protein
MKKQVIGLCGFAQSGKDSAAKFLTSEKSFVRVAFADAVRDGLYALNPLIWIKPDESKTFDNWLGVIRLELLVNRFGWEDAKKCSEVRSLLQRYGTEAGRDIHGPQCWTQIGLRAAAKYDRVVFTDVRFESEVDAVKSIGGIVVRINREGVGPVNGHASDQRLADHLIDFEIDNNGILEDLRDEIFALVG